MQTYIEAFGYTKMNADTWVNEHPNFQSLQIIGKNVLPFTDQTSQKN